MYDKPIPFDLPEGYVEFYKAIESWQNELFFKLKRAAGIGDFDADSIPRVLRGRFWKPTVLTLIPFITAKLFWN